MAVPAASAVSPVPGFDRALQLGCQGLLDLLDLPSQSCAWPTQHLFNFSLVHSHFHFFVP